MPIFRLKTVVQETRDNTNKNQTQIKTMNKTQQITSLLNKIAAEIAVLEFSKCRSVWTGYKKSLTDSGAGVDPDFSPAPMWFASDLLEADESAVLEMVDRAASGGAAMGAGDTDADVKFLVSGLVRGLLADAGAALADEAGFTSAKLTAMAVVRGATNMLNLNN